MLDRLNECVGFSVVIDYKTNTGKVVFAKGILKEVLKEQNMLIVESIEGIVWYISFLSITSMKLEDKNV